MIKKWSIFHPKSGFWSSILELDLSSKIRFLGARFWCSILIQNHTFGARFWSSILSSKISKSDEIFGSQKISKSHEILSDFLKSHWSLRVFKILKIISFWKYIELEPFFPKVRKCQNIYVILYCNFSTESKNHVLLLPTHEKSSFFEKSDFNDAFLL